MQAQAGMFRDQGQAALINAGAPCARQANERNAGTNERNAGTNEQSRYAAHGGRYEPDARSDREVPRREH